MSYRSKVQLIQAREIIAGFLLWHDPAYHPGPNESLEKQIEEARVFLWGPEAKAAAVSDEQLDIVDAIQAAG